MDRLCISRDTPGCHPRKQYGQCQIGALTIPVSDRELIARSISGHVTWPDTDHDSVRSPKGVPAGKDASRRRPVEPPLVMSSTLPCDRTIGASYGNLFILYSVKQFWICLSQQAQVVMPRPIPVRTTCEPFPVRSMPTCLTWVQARRINRMTQVKRMSHPQAAL